MLEKTLHIGSIPSLIQDRGENVMQLWTEINVVTLFKFFEMMRWQMCAVIKANGGYLFCFFVVTVYVLFHFLSSVLVFFFLGCKDAYGLLHTVNSVMK